MLTNHLGYQRRADNNLLKSLIFASEGSHCLSEASLRLDMSILPFTHRHRPRQAGIVTV